MWFVWFFPIFLVQLLASTPLKADFKFEECIAKTAFKIQAMYSWSEQVFLEKKDCSLAYYFEHGGKKETWRFNICNPRLSLEYFPSAEVKNPEVILIGSAHCSKPLFEIDDELTEKDMDRFPKERAHLRDLMKKVRKDKMLNSMSAQINCFERLEEAYLDDCRAFDLPKQNAK